MKQYDSTTMAILIACFNGVDTKNYRNERKVANIASLRKRRIFEMGQIWKRILSVILSITMLFSMTGIITVYATERAVNERNTILNLNLNNNALTDKDGVVLPTAANGIYDMLDAEGWKWDNNTLTLTMNGLNMNVPNFGAILLPSNATIEVIGTNSIVCGTEYGNAITGFESLIIKGNGTLDISSKLVSIFSSGDLVIAGGIINATSTKDSAIFAIDTLEIGNLANVTTSGYFCGLQANGGGIDISGAIVKAASSNDAAIYTKGTLTMQESANVTATESFYAGINASKGITISNSTVKAGSGPAYTAIYTPQAMVINGTSNVTADGDWVGILGETYLTINDRAEVVVTGKSTGLQSLDTQISGSAVVTATSINASAISGANNLSITENAEVVATGAQAGIVSNGAMTLSAKYIKATGGWYGIDNEGGNASGITIGGKLIAEATGSGYGIYSVKTILADDKANITAIGAYSGISTIGDITLHSSKVDTIGKNGAGITSRGKISIIGGNIHAKSSAGYAAIRVENMQVAGEVAESKISLTNLIEMNGGKVAFSDWVNNNGETISWTTFISKDDDKLAMVDGGLFTNGLLEVWLAAPYTVTFDVNGGSGTTSTVNVYPGNKVTAPAYVPTKDGCHFSGWYLDNTKFDFINTAIFANTTLKAKLDVHTPNADDKDCTTAITCSECGEIITMAKMHDWDIEWSKDTANHWKKCKNVDCIQIKDVTAHTYGNWIIDQASTETEIGSKHRDCSVCSYRETATIPLLPHTHAPKTEWSKNVDKHWQDCIANDGERLNEAAHTWNNGEISTQATHTQNGVKTFTCTVCGQTKAEVIPAIDHTWSTDWSNDTLNHWHECTAKDGGIKNKAEHTYGKWVIDKVATETEAGSKHRVCSVCGYREVTIVPMLPHTHIAKAVWSKNAETHWQDCVANDGVRLSEALHTWNSGEITTPSTDMQDGVKTFTCTVCGQIKKETIPKLPSNLIMEDLSTGVKVEYENGSSFETDIILSVITQSQVEMDKFKVVVDKVAPSLTLGELYNIALLKDGIAIQPAGRIKISIPLTNKMKSMTNIQVIYIDANGNAAIIPSQIIDGKIIFIADHFNYYGVIGKVKEPSDDNKTNGNDNNSDTPQTGNSAANMPFGLLALASGTALVILSKKKKELKSLKK